MSNRERKERGKPRWRVCRLCGQPVKDDNYLCEGCRGGVSAEAKGKDWESSVSGYKKR